MSSRCIQTPHSFTKINLKSISIYLKYIMTEKFINRQYSKYIKMYKWMRNAP